MPSCAAPAATVRPPAPAPITHRSARISPPPVPVPTIGADLGLTATAAPSPGATRIKPTAPSLGCCMSGPPPPEGDRNERNHAQKQQRQYEFLGDKRACVDRQLASLLPPLGQASGVVGLGGHDHAVEPRARGRERERGGDDTE